jgi:cell wall-associated NlpC family hydrolase
MMALALACAGGDVSAPEIRPLPAPERPRQEETDVVGLARDLLGSAYRFGGADRRGFDCSGLTSYVLRRQGVELPRTTEEQAAAGRWVPLDELAIGDLVFFHEPGLAPHHVGIVSSRPGEPLRMIHASTSQGVVETDVLASAYWLRRLGFGRRVLPPR